MVSRGQGGTVHNFIRKNDEQKGYNNPFSEGRRAQRQATRFRTQNETTRLTKLVGEYGNNEFVLQHGRKNITKHTNVLSSLEKQELRYRKKVQVQLDTDEVLYNDAVDEKGIFSTASLMNPDVEC